MGACQGYLEWRFYFRTLVFTALRLVRNSYWKMYRVGHLLLSVQVCSSIRWFVKWGLGLWILLWPLSPANSNIF